MLGIYFGPTSGGSKHVRKMARKGYVWADRLRSCPLSPALAWQSFTHQLQPGIMWAIATIVMSPKKLLDQFQRVYFRCLPLLNVNCHICENILRGYLYVFDLAFSHHDGIHGFKFPSRFLGISCRDLTSLLLN